jgi:hypothetical protein
VVSLVADLTPGGVLTAAADRLDHGDSGLVDWIDVSAVIGNIADTTDPDGILRGKTVRMLAGHLDVADLAVWLPSTRPRRACDVAAAMRQAACGAVTS